MIELDLIRHGRPEEDRGKGNVYSSEAQLSYEGRLEVMSLIKVYTSRGVIFDTVYTSSTRRARETAEMITGGKLVLIVVGELREPDWGSIAGQELYPRVVERARRGFKAIVERTRPDNRIAIVTHGPIIKILADMLRNPDSPLPLSDRDLPETDLPLYAEAIHIILDDIGNIKQEERISRRIP